MSKFPPFKKLVNKQRHRVVEMLSLGGDFPQGAETPCTQDWQHVLLEGTCDLFEQLRFDDSDPEVVKQVRKKLAKIAAICEEWDKAVMEDAK